MDTSQPEVPEDELLSATGEGDEVMEEVEEQEGYSSCLHICPSAYYIYFECYFPPSYRPCFAICRAPNDANLVASFHLTSIVNAYVIPDLDQLVLFFTWP